MTVYAFSVSCEPGFANLSRVFDVLCVLGHEPVQVYARRDGDAYVLDLVCEDLDATRAERIANRLRALVAVSCVLLSPKHFYRDSLEGGTRAA